MPVLLAWEGVNLKELVKKIWNYFFEIFIWYSFLWICGLVVVCTYIFPEQGITALIGAVVLTVIPKIYKKFKNEEE